MKAWLSGWNVPRFFLIGAILLNVIYLYHFNPLADYAHGSARFFHITHLANSLLGEPDKMPLSMLETIAQVMPEKVKDVSSINFNDWDPKAKRFADLTKPAVRPTFFQLLKIPLNPEDTFAFRSNWSASLFSVAGYLPYVIGALIGLLLGLPPVAIMYLSIIINAVLIITLGYYTVRLFPVMRWAACYILLSPMAAMARVYFMPDALAIDLCLLMLAIGLRLSYEPRVLAMREKGWLVVLAAMVGLIKVCYLLVPMILLITQHRCFGTRWAKCRIIACCMIVSIAAGTWWGMHVANTQGIYPSYNYKPEEITTKEPWQSPYVYTGRIYFVLTHPVEYLRVLTVTFYNGFGNTWAIITVLTSNYNWMSDDAIRIAVLPLLLLPLFGYEAVQRGNFRWFDRLITLGVFIASIGAIYTTRFLYVIAPLWWHQQNNFYMLGRYLIPVILLLPMAWHSLLPVPRRIAPAAGLVIAVFTIACLIYLHHRQMQGIVQIF